MEVDEISVSVKFQSLTTSRLEVRVSSPCSRRGTPQKTRRSTPAQEPRSPRAAHREVTSPPSRPGPPPFSRFAASEALKLTLLLNLRFGSSICCFSTPRSLFKMFPKVLNTHNLITTEEFSSTTSTTATITVPTNTTTTTTSGFHLNLHPWIHFNVHSIAATTSVPSIVTPVVTYARLNDMTRNVKLELPDEDKKFLQLATQVSIWDRKLDANLEELTVLHGRMEKVKMHQRRLKLELSCLMVEQKELQEMLNPIETYIKQQNEDLNVENDNEES
ncbi:PREDICTED: nucleoporin-62 C-terminal-like protein [Dipodomys ordii]|uniref:Nucleoporin-62 C-terminal-like protein n=1 Tax=Dipodomys ordii TaxID=10020 RepID=A0A1S3FZ27_DIPOR|nr:PREDICTED: nucleoporin-62 C-terminal-like protein [Dipodomys ordii]